MSPKYKRSPRNNDEKAIDRFLRSPEGRKLLEDLSKGFAGMEANVTIELKFKDSVGPREAGEISPQKPVFEADGQRMTYSGKIGRNKDRDVGGPATYYPDSGGFSYTYVEGVSEMASTIYHEIQHVYFMNRSYFGASAEGADPSVDNSFSLGGPAGEVLKIDVYGHALGDAARDSGNYDLAFLDGLRKFAGDLDGIERCFARQGVAPTATPGPTARAGPTASPGPTAAPGRTASPDSRRRGSGAPR